jgi:chromosome segregation ATPase
MHEEFPMSTKKPDDTRELVEQARSFSKQFGSLMQVAGMLDQVGSLREELEALAVERDRATHELNVLWGERDGELQKLTEQIEAGLKAKYDEAERVLAQEAAARKSLQDLGEDLVDRRRKLTSLEQAIMRAEGQYGEISTKLARLRGAIPA